MSVRKVFLASVSAAFLAASAAVSGSAAAATPSPNLVLTQEAYKSLAAGDANGAVVNYSIAIESRELEPEVLANALLNRGFAYQSLNQHQQAVDDYTAALRLDAMSAKLRAMALYNRALSYQKLARTGLAMEDYTSALFLDSEFAYAYYGRGNLLRDSGQYLFALTDYEKARRYKYPDMARVHFSEALTFAALRRPENERQSLELALAANPQFIPAKDRLAALDGGAMAPALIGDQIVTGSISAIGGKLVARKAELPAAQEPSAELVGAAAETPAPAQTAELQVASLEAPVKKITDRIPMEEAAPAPAAAPVQEKIVAVEAVPDEPIVAAVSDTAPEPTATVQSGWSVQIASATSEDAAWSAWKKMQNRYKVLADKTPVVVKADLGTKGTFYRVRLMGYDKQGDAKQACSKLKSSGVACYVSKASS